METKNTEVVETSNTDNMTKMKGTKWIEKKEENEKD